MELNFCVLFGHINWLWLAVATVLSMAIGALWYGKLFSKAWVRANDVQMPEKIAQWQMILPFVVQMLATALLAVYIFIAVQVSACLLAFGLLAFLGWQKSTLKYRIMDMKKFITAACIDLGYFAIVSTICILFAQM